MTREFVVGVLRGACVIIYKATEGPRCPSTCFLSQIILIAHSTTFNSPHILHTDIMGWFGTVSLLQSLVFIFVPR
jgi:hypothetical protein